MCDARDPDVTAVPEGENDPAVGAMEAPAGPGGWRSQGLPLKVLLLASIAIVVFAVARCSIELTPESGGIEKVGVLPPSIDVPEGVLPAEPDSIAGVAARQLARMLESASGAAVHIVESPADSLDVVAKLSLTSSRGNVTAVLELVDDRSRVLSRSQSEGPPRHLYAIIGITALSAAGDVWPAGGDDQQDRM